MCPSVHRTRTILGIFGIQGHSISGKKNLLHQTGAAQHACRCVVKLQSAYSALKILSSGSCCAVELDAKNNKRPLDVGDILYMMLLILVTSEYVKFDRVRSRFKISRIHCCNGVGLMLSHLAICASSTNITKNTRNRFLYHM